jgi:hypothetical protein
MSHRPLFLLAITVLLPGCVSVTEPLSDPDKAQPDKRLLGQWQRGDESQRCAIDAPAVKGHPKGLLRAVYNGKSDDPQNAFWFFTTPLGKYTYATIYVQKGKGLSFADFRKEGAFEAWNQGKQRRYFVFRYVLDGDKLTVDGGGSQAVEKLMKAEKIEARRGYFQTPPGWLARYLGKHGPQALYDGTNVQHWERVTK